VKDEILFEFIEFVQKMRQIEKNSKKKIQMRVIN